MSLFVCNQDSFNNRIFCCLVISFTEMAIRYFQSIPTLLKVLYDAIKVHKSLLMNGKILHRDIFKNNIIITDSEKADDFVSMLIDLNLVKELCSKLSNV